MQSDLTETVARKQMLDYMTRTLGVFPPGTSFRFESASTAGDFFRGTPTPCDDNDHDATGPVDLALDYWIHGIRSSTFDEVLQSVISAWKSWGWSTAEENEPGYLRGKATTPDGYILRVDDNRRGGYSITSGSPCFPRANTGTATPQPPVIERPHR